MFSWAAESRSRGRVRAPAELGQLEYPACAGPPLLLVAFHLARTEEEVEQPLARVAFRSEDEVLEDREVAELVRNLPRLCEAQVNDLVRRQAVDPRGVKPDLPAVGAAETCHEFE